MASDLDTPAAVRAWWKAWPSIVAVLLVVLTLGGGVIYVQAGWRAREMAARSAASLARGDVRMAVLQAESAHRLRGSDAGVARARVAALSAAGDPRAVDAWTRLAGSARLTADEERARAESAAGLASDADFDRLVASHERAGRPAEAARWRGFRASARFDHAAAAAHLQQALDIEPTAARRLDLARVLAGMGAPGALARAAILVGEADDSPAGRELLAFGLDFLPQAGAATRLVWARRAMADKAPDNPALLPAASMLVAEGHASQPEVVADLSPVFAEAGPAARVAFARWLAGRGEAAKAATLLPGDEARLDSGVFFARADVLAAAGDWPALLDLATGPSPAGEWQTLLQRARAEDGLGREGAAAVTIRRAVRLAAARGQLAAASGWLDAQSGQALADEILLALCGEPQFADQALRVARWRHGARGETHQLEQCLRRAAEVAPNAPPVLDLQRRARLLAGEPVAPAETAAAWEAEPGNLELQLTHALALLRAGRAAEARMIVPPTGPSAPGQRAIVAAVLAASGSSGQAVEILRATRPDQLSDGEYRLVYELVSVRKRTSMERQAASSRRGSDGD